MVCEFLTPFSLSKINEFPSSLLLFWPLFAAPQMLHNLHNDHHQTSQTFFLRDIKKCQDNSPKRRIQYLKLFEDGPSFECEKTISSLFQAAQSTLLIAQNHNLTKTSGLNENRKGSKNSRGVQ